MGYMEVCLKVKNAGWIEVDDPEGPYAYNKDKTIWVGYDTPGKSPFNICIFILGIQT